MENGNTALSFNVTLNRVLLRNNIEISPDIVLLMSNKCEDSFISSLDEVDPKRIRALFSTPDTGKTKDRVKCRSLNIFP